MMHPLKGKENKFHKQPLAYALQSRCSYEFCNIHKKHLCDSKKTPTQVQNKCKI